MSTGSTPGGQVAVTVVINTTGIAAGMGRANQQINQSAQQTGQQAGNKIGDGIKAGVKAAGAAAGVAITASMLDALNRGAENDKMAAALGLSPEDAKRAASVSADVYKDAWGASTADVSAAVKSVMEQIDGMRTASDADLMATSEAALALAQTFDVDVSEAAASAGTMIKTGMAKDSKEAFDIITAGFQHGVDKKQDYLDTLTEYSTQFRKLGIDGATATGMLSQGLGAGARDADKVGDALKELSIRAIDGSKTTQDAYAALGLSASDMTARFAAGGQSASGALSEVLGRLRAMKDPAAQSAAAVGLFGTQAEDLGAALYALDPTTAAQGLGQVAGAAQNMTNTVGDNAKTKIEGYKRSLQDLGYSAVEHTGMWGAGAAAIASFAPSILSVLGPMAMMTSAWGAGTAAVVRNSAAWVGNTAALAANRAAWAVGQIGTVIKFLALATIEIGKSTLAWVANTAAQVANRLASLAMAAVSLVVRAATVAWTAVQWLLNVALSANPIGIIIMAVAALVAGIIYAYKHSETFRNIVQAAGRAAAAAFGWVVDKVKAIWHALGAVVDWVKGHWQVLLALLTGPFGVAVLWITKHWDSIMAFFKEVPGRLAGLFKTVANAITAPFRAAFNAVAGLWNSTIGKLSWTVPDWVPMLGGHTIAAPKLPELQGLATGGTVVRAGAFMVGERGPEQVFLPAGAAVVPNGGGGAGGPITININGGDPAEVRRVVEDAIAGNNRRLASAYRAQLAV